MSGTTTSDPADRDLIEWNKRPSGRDRAAGFPQQLRLQNRTWIRDAACRGSGPTVARLFYAPDEETPEQERERVRQAVAICRGCRARAECLRWALQVNDLHGIYGGTTPAHRRRIQRNNRGPVRFQQVLGQLGWPQR